MDHVAKRIHLDYAIAQNLTGKNIGIAIMDTGIGEHPDLIQKNGCLQGFYDAVNQSKYYYDDNGHGTHVAGIIAGSGRASYGRYRGIAPDCRIYMIKILNQRGEGNVEHILKGIEWILENYQKYQIRIINLSVGSTKNKHFNEQSPLVTAINKLWEAGLIVLTAAGNNGPTPYSIGAPGNSRKIITVGASDIMRTGYQKDYSGRGPTEECVKKPDIVAPGSHIVSCHPSSLRSYNGHPIAGKQKADYRFNAPYLSRSGTSMATPIVSACIALLLEKYPKMTNRDVKFHLRNTAFDLGYPHSRQGWGEIRCDWLL